MDSLIDQGNTITNTDNPKSTGSAAIVPKISPVKTDDNSIEPSCSSNLNKATILSAPVKAQVNTIDGEKLDVCGAMSYNNDTSDKIRAQSQSQSVSTSEHGNDKDNVSYGVLVNAAAPHGKIIPVITYPNYTVNKIMQDDLYMPDEIMHNHHQVDAINLSNVGGGDAPYVGALQPVASNTYTIANELHMHDLSVASSFNQRYCHRNEIVDEDLDIPTARTPFFSRKVFIGGLPPDMTEMQIVYAFRRFQPFIIDWPHKDASASVFPPRGYAFLVFPEEDIVKKLLNLCIMYENKLLYSVSSTTIRNKLIEVRPWRLIDIEYMLHDNTELDPRKTVFVGGVPRPLKACELALIMDRLYGYVGYVSINVDTDLQYPKGAARVTFYTQQSYIAAISSRFVHIQCGDIDKCVEVKPYVLNDQMCDKCNGQFCPGEYARLFCGNVTCLKYYCEQCWRIVHARFGFTYHRPMIKERSDRPRGFSYRCW